MTTYRIKIAVDAKNATVGTEKVSKGLKKVKNNADRARVSIGRMFTVLLAVSAVRRAVRSIADFEQAISTIEAVTQGSTQQMQQMIATARELGATTVFTATQAADGLVLLSRAGFSANESLEAIGDTLNLARAGGIGIARATEIAADTMRAFGIEAENTARVVDVLALASSRSNTTVEQLGQALKFAAPIARGLGVSIEETNAALGALADAGQKASIGGTGLRRVMAKLESPTAKARNTLRSLGLEAADVQVSSVGLTKALANLAKAGVSTSEIFDIFGKRSGTAAQVLVANIPKLEQMRKTLDGAGGTAKEMADVMGRNLNDALFKVVSAFNELRLSIASAGLSNVLTETLKAVALGFRILADNGTLVLGVMTAFGVVILTAVVPAVASLIVNMGILNGVMLANPLVLAGAAVIGALVAFTSQLTKLNAVTNGTAEGMGKVSDELARLQKVNNIGRAIDRLNEAIDANGKATALQASMLERLNKAYDVANGKVEDYNDNQKKFNDSIAASVPSVANLLASLNRQASALGNVTEEQKLQAAAEKELARIRTASKGEAVIAKGDLEKVKAALAFVQAKREEAKVLKQVQGPQQDAERRYATLNRLLEQGKLNAEQYGEEIKKLSAELPAVRLSEEFNAQVDGLKLANEQMRLRATLSGTELAFQLELLRLGVAAQDLTAQQLTDLFKEIQANEALTALLKKQTAEKTKAKAAEEDAALAATNAKKREVALLTEIGAIDSLVGKRKELLALAEKHPLAIEQIQVALDNLTLKGLESSTALGDGFTRAFMKMQNEANDFAAVGEGMANAFADNVTNALTKIATEGAFTWREFTNALLADITRIITRLLVMQAISAALGGGGGAPALPGVSAGEPLFRASGGAVQKDRSFIVGENGPELFTPGTKGNISPAGTTAGMQQAAPQMNVQVVNVDDPEMVPQSISDGSSDEAIVNVISRNRDKFKGMF